MHFARKALVTSVIAAACAVPGALLLSATAAADPVPPAPTIPSMPNIPFLNALTPGNAPQLLQGLASAFSGTPAAAAPAAAPAPAATASVTLPQTPAAAAPLAAAPAAAAPAAAPAGLVPTAEVQIPQVAGSPLPLPKELNFPGDLASLMPAGTPLAGLLPRSPAAVPVAAAAPVAAALPAATAAAAPAVPAATDGLGALSPLMFPVAGLP